MNRPLFWYLCLPAILLVIFPLRLHGTINPHDEGVWLATLQAMMEGKRLYRDITLQYNPILPCVLDIFLSALHPTLSLIRGLIWGFNALGLLVITLATLRLIKNELLRLMLILFLWMVPSAAFSPMIPMAARYAAGFLPILFWPVHDFASLKSRTGSAWIAGFLAGIAFWIAQEVGTAALIAGFFIFVMDQEEKAEVIHYVLGAFVVLATGILILSFRCGLHNYLEAAVFQTARVVHAESLPLPMLSRTLFWESLAQVLAIYLPALSYVGMIVWGATGQNRFRGWKRTGIGLALYGLLAASSAWGRTDRWHIYFSLSPALLLWAYVVDQPSPRRPTMNSILFLLFLLAGGLITIPPYIGTTLREHRYAANQRGTTLTRAGMSRLPVWQANGYEALVGWIQNHIRPGEPFLFFPYNGAIYFLADRPNPTRLPNLALAVPLDVQDKAIRDIEAAKVHWVIWDSENKDFDGIPIERFLSHLSVYVKTNYIERERLGPFVFMERNNPL